ncbi:MAG: glycosyltransferase family 2 protein, partial [Flavobacteriaceae bacterium]
RQDWALWHKAILSSGIPAQGLDQVLAAYRISPQSMSAKKLGLIRHNFAFYRQYLGYTWLKSCLWMAVFFVTYFTQRKRLIRRSN